MKKGFRFALFAWILLSNTATVDAKTFLLRTEDLEMPGGWAVESGAGVTKGARRYLIAPTAAAAKAPVVGAVEIPHAGKWRVWVRSRDFVNDRPGTRSFSLRLGETLLERSFGTHGQIGDDGWAWEDGGMRDLKAGPLLVVIGERCQHSARCEAILLTDNMSYVPEGVSWLLHKEAAKVLPVKLSEASKQEFSTPPMEQVEEKPVAELKNETLQITFHSGHTKSGKAVGMKVATATGDGKWETFSDAADVASYRVLMRPLDRTPGISRGRVYPSWDIGLSPTVEVSAGTGVAKTSMGPATIPWLSGKCLPMLPVAAKQKDERTVELSFAASPAGQLYATWILEPGRADALVRMTFKPAQAGHYSLGFHGPMEVDPEQADSWLLPFQFHDRRFPKDPVLQLNSTTPTPLTLVNRKGVSCALVADPALIPFEWQRADASRYGFGLRNEKSQAQPIVYSPVMGLPGSRSEGNSPVTTRFRFWVQRGDWYAAYRSIADGLFQLKDYREPTTFSLTDSVFNLMDLMRDQVASGWDAKAKGTVQIESRNVVTQCSPLTYLSLYLLTGDRDFYDQLARPSLEFLLSRPEAHFAIEKEIGDNYYQHQPMEGPVRLYGASTYASALAMTQGKTAAFGEQTLLKNGSLRRTPPHGHGQPFNDALMLYRVTGEKRWLDQAVTNADEYLAKLKEKKPLSDPNDRYFVNVSYTSDWEGLLQMYEVTGEKRFLEVAIEGARALLTTVWTQPVIPDKTVKLNPGGIYDHSRHIWWWGDGLKRLGVYEGAATEKAIETPPPKIPEREVPAWSVSNVGLGLEHPFTYVRREGQANILMSVWAANFLRMSEASGDPAFRVAARNAMIGRYANYPGYYLDGQTDEFRRADYPSKGPDITSLYLHHIAPFTASVLDFLFTDAEIRSKGEVVFPTVRQMGYVWFDSRLWGHAPGSVYGQMAWPWLHRTAVTVDNPKVDHLLAQGDGRLHIILMNQSLEAQTVRVKLDETIVGKELGDATLVARLNSDVVAPVTVKDGLAEVSLPVKGLMALTLDGVKIDVPTQRIIPSRHVALPTAPASTRVNIVNTKWQGIATTIEVPPFLWRDFYAYVNCGREDLKSATLLYRIGEGQERRQEVSQFPFEFSVRIENLTGTFHWALEAVLPDGTKQKTAWQ